VPLTCVYTDWGLYTGFSIKLQSPLVNKYCVTLWDDLTRFKPCDIT